MKTPLALQRLYPARWWRLPPNDASRPLYLTFDDGPVPGVTDPVLDALAAHGARATFFAVGANAARHPALVRRIVAEGHALGNHTQHHVSGWGMGPERYLAEVAAADATLAAQGLPAPGLFRPPYGRLQPLAASAIARDKKIVMWDVLAGDFDARQTPDGCLANVVAHVAPGSIVVLHDSAKCAPRMLPMLAPLLAHLTREGFTLLPLPCGFTLSSTC